MPVHDGVLSVRASASRAGAGMLLASLAFALFATADAAAKYLSRDYAVPQILFLGSIVAFIPAVSFLMATDGLASIRPRQTGLCLLRGALTALSVLAIIWSFTKLPLADGYTLAFTAPLIVAGLSGWLLNEPVARSQWTAVFIGFLGVLVMLRPGFSAINIGHAAALGSAMIFALALIVLRRLGNTETPGALLVTYLSVTLAIYGPLAAIFWIMPGALLEWLLMALIGIVSGCGQIALILAFRAAPAAIVAPFQYTQMIWGLFFGFLLFGDLPDAAMALGGAMVIGGGWLSLRQTTS